MEKKHRLLDWPNKQVLYARSMMPIATERTANQRSAIYEYLEVCNYLNICGGDCERTVRHIEMTMEVVGCSPDGWWLEIRPCCFSWKLHQILVSLLLRNIYVSLSCRFIKGRNLGPTCASCSLGVPVRDDRYLKRSLWQAACWLRRFSGFSAFPFSRANPWRNHEQRTTPGPEGIKPEKVRSGSSTSRSMIFSARKDQLQFSSPTYVLYSAYRPFISSIVPRAGPLAPTPSSLKL